MNTNHCGIFGELSRRDFLASSSLSLLGSLVSGRELPAQSDWTELNPLFETKLGIKFVVGGMVHETAHEGPCRTGKLESLTYQAESQSCERQFNQFVKGLKDRQLPREAKILEPVDFRVLVREKNVEFQFEEKYFRQIEKDRDGPYNPVRQPHVLADRVEIRFAHEPFERSEPAVGNVDDLVCNLASNRNRFESLDLGGSRFGLQDPLDNFFSTMSYLSHGFPFLC